MIWILIISFIIILIQIFVISLFFSNIVLDIEECDISYNDNYQKKVDIKKLKVNVKIYLFKKIKILNIKIYKNYCEIFKMKINLNILKKLKDDNQSGFIYVIKNIGKLNPKIKNVNLKIALGTEDTMITTFLIPIISTVLSLVISNYMEENMSNVKGESNYNFKIMPQYINTNNFNLNGSARISFDTFRTLFFIKKHSEIKV